MGLIFAAGCGSKGGPASSSDGGGLGNFTSTLSLFFNPMYSGYDGMHTYQIPVTIDNAGETIPNVRWSASDPSMVDIAATSDPNTVMITTKKAGSVRIIAQTDTAIGIAPLTIAAYTPDQWTMGQTRYTSGTPTSLRGQLTSDGGADKYVQCTSCHGDSPMSLAVQHTPEQTGGFTDDELKNIFLHGQIPAADLTVLNITADDFASFHQWSVGSDAEANGLLAYLRSLTPKDQGPLNFGGRGQRDGGYGRGDGGYGRRDGGGYPPPDAGM
jgi:hypothetical protein